MIGPLRTTFIFNHAGQVDEFGIATGDYQEVQRLFDLRAQQNLDDINNIKSSLASTTDGDSGADNVKITPISGVTGLNVQEVLEYLATNMSGVLTNKADKTNVIEKDSTVPYTPTAQYHPTNKGYVDYQIAQAVIGSISLIKATEQEAIEGTNDVKYMTPLKVKQAIENVIKYQDVTNLSATTAGVITWNLPLTTDFTRTAIMLCIATKDISNFDYATCLADGTVTKNTLGKDVVTNTYTGLTNNTQYWVKSFVEYTIGGKKYYSGGVTVTFTTPAFQEISNLTVNPYIESVTWTLPNGSAHTNVEVCYSKTNISEYTYAQCQADSSVTKAELASNATSYTVNVLDKMTYYVKVFLRYSSQYSNGVAKSWSNPKQWLYKAGNENIAVTGGWESTMNGSIIKNPTNITIDMALANSTCAATTKNMITLIGLKTLRFEVESTHSGTSRVIIGPSTNSQGYGPSPTLSVTSNIPKQILSLDVSNVQTNSYITALVNTPSGTTAKLIMYNIWGES